MIALQPLGLTAAAGALSIGSMAGGLYALILMRNATATSGRLMLAEVWPAAVAATIAAGAVLALELLVVDAESHGIVLGLLLLAAEALAGLFVYLALLRVLAPAVAAEIGQGAGRLLRRLARFRGGDPPVPEPEILDETLAP
jgi:hypothetical protein